MVFKVPSFYFSYQCIRETLTFEFKRAREKYSVASLTKSAEDCLGRHGELFCKHYHCFIRKKRKTRRILSMKR